MLWGFSQCGQLWRSLVAQDAMLLLRGKYLLNFTGGINCVCLCPYSTISQHIPPFPSISQYWHGRRFTIAVRCSENTDSLWSRNKESHLLVEGGKFLCSRSNKSKYGSIMIHLWIYVYCVYVSVTYYASALCILSNIYIYIYIYTYSTWSSYSQTLPSQCTRSKGADLATWLTSASWPH